MCKYEKDSENAGAVRNAPSSFADRDGTAVHLQYGVSAGNEREARSELERRLINQELFNYSILEIRRATSTEAASLDLPAGTIRLLN